MTEPPAKPEPVAPPTWPAAQEAGGVDSTVRISAAESTPEPSPESSGQKTTTQGPAATSADTPSEGGTQPPKASPQGSNAGHAAWGDPSSGPFAARYGLVRPINGRYFAGVCAAIGRATSTDPILWRIMLGVLAVFGGIGLVAYLVGWLLTPSEGDTASPLEALLGRGRSATSPVLSAIIGAGAVLLLLFAMSDGFRTALLGLGVIIGVALLLSRREHGGRSFPQPTYPASPPPGPRPTAPPGVGPHAPYGPFPTPPGYQGGYSQPWPPMPPQGYPTPPPVPPAGPPVPPAPRPRPPRSPLGRITLSLLCLVLGTLIAIDLTTADLLASTYLAATVTMIALGLLVGTWFGRARWLIPIGMILAVVLAGVTVAERVDPPRSTGNQTWTPTSVERIEPSYENKFGNGLLDLSGVDFTNHDVTIDLSSEFGRFEVFLPQNVDVDLTATVEFGEADVFGGRWHGGGDGRHRVRDTGLDGKGGGNLTINADVEFGNLEVHR